MTLRLARLWRPAGMATGLRRLANTEITEVGIKPGGGLVGSWRKVSGSKHL